MYLRISRIRNTVSLFPFRLKYGVIARYMSSMVRLHLVLMRFSVLDLLVLVGFARRCVTLLLKLLSQVLGISMLIMIGFLSIYYHIY